MTTQSHPSPEASEPWIPSTKSLGARLALVRQALHWNAKEAALACGFAQQNWRDWEKGSQPRDLNEAVRKIVARTNVDEYWLLTGKTVSGAQQPLHLSEQPELPGFQLAA